MDSFYVIVIHVKELKMKAFFRAKQREQMMFTPANAAASKKVRAVILELKILIEGVIT